MKYKILVLLILLVSIETSYSKEKGVIEKNLPAESLTVHLTQECIFPGETVWFKIYCTSPLFPETELSRMAYIELVNQDNASILRKKILLTDGEGKGEFFISEEIPSGVYHILAYTNWLKNFGETAFFVKSVAIINPNREFEYLETYNDLMSGSVVEKSTAGSIKITPDKNQYSPREKVKLVIKNAEGQATINGGSYSVSVMQKVPGMHEKITSNSSANNRYVPDSITTLPDYKGIRLTGNISDDSGNPVAGELISISYPGPGTDIDGTKTDKNGDFHFLLEPDKGEKDIIFTLPSSNLKLKLAEPFQNGFRNPPVPAPLVVDKNAINFLKVRNDHLQLQKKFKQQNFNKINPVTHITNSNYRFYGEANKVIEMNEYIELDSLAEYFWELIPSVKFTPKRGNFNILVTDPNTFYPYNDAPGVFIDGVLYDDYHEIAEIPVEEVKQLAILNKEYYYREFTFGGIVDIHTKQNNFEAVKLLPGMIRMMYPLGSPTETGFIKIDHSNTNSLSRIPDLRYLLCWQPDIVLNENGEAVVEFYTSDIEGDFVIQLFGISGEGQLIQTENEISVKNRLYP